MFKVTFKQNPKNSFRLITKVGNETTVMLEGIIDLPDLRKYIPTEVVEWITNQSMVEGYENTASNQLIIYSRGMSKCHPDDKYDVILGERLAESRAKQNIYKFMYYFCKKIFEYFNTALRGNDYVCGDECEPNSLLSDVLKYKKLWWAELDHFEKLRRNNDE